MAERSSETELSGKDSTKVASWDLEEAEPEEVGGIADGLLVVEGWSMSMPFLHVTEAVYVLRPRAANRLSPPLLTEK